MVKEYIEPPMSDMDFKLAELRNAQWREAEDMDRQASIEISNATSAISQLVLSSKWRLKQYGLEMDHQREYRLAAINGGYTLPNYF